MIPEDAAERMARKLREIGVVDSDEGTMPIFVREDAPERKDGARIDYWTPHHDVAKAIVDEVRSWTVPKPLAEDEDAWCVTCQDYFRFSDHYHCHRCGSRTGMMGHDCILDFSEKDEPVAEVVRAFEQGGKSVTAEVVRSLGWKPCSRWYAHDGHKFWGLRGEGGPWLCPGRPCSRREPHERHIVPMLHYSGHEPETCPGRP